MVDSRVQYRIDDLCYSQNVEEADTKRRQFYADFNGRFSEEDAEYVIQRITSACVNLDSPDARQRELRNQFQQLGYMAHNMRKDR